MDTLSTRRATLFIMALFFLQPTVFGAWLAMIPHVKTTLELSKSQLALALLGMPLALIPTLQIASRIVARLGPRRAFFYMLPVQAAVMLLPLFAPNLPALFASLAVIGIVVAFLQVSLNTYAGRLEKAADVMVMSRCHGFWALGVSVGSFLATLLFDAGPVLAVLTVGAISAVAGMFAAPRLPRLLGQDEGPAPRPQRLSQMPRALFVISIFVLAVSLVEGAMSDWAAIYLADRWGSGADEAGIAVTIFSGFLAAGRFMGDGLKRRMGARGAARLTVGLALLGLLSLTGPMALPFVFAGFALIGLGASIAFPLGVSAAAALDDVHEAQNIATMSMIAISGLLIGPPLIGFLSEAVGLRFALMALAPGLFLSLVLTGVFPTRKPRGTGGAAAPVGEAPL
ncbi:MFS transporter [Thalassorhabdomicrobium marinisediminis]|uniref:MFS transporter n=1 Tax=Thalassorhabdomicrobium marinisediminis TaxID=2170577 RepID=UPI002492B43E|nr:MFS transporter [Thalassorhabdomicrobium marinisediminis]